MDVMDRVKSIGPAAAGVREAMVDSLDRHRRYIREHGEDLPEIREWRWERT
jgi:xylulose-5-phosphate/fructose-6-phosphate phosphoketolase